MNTRQQLLIDKFVAKPAAFILNYFVRFVGMCLSLDHSLDKPFKRIAMCKFKGMGSILQATPMIHSIRMKFPEAEIIFVSTKSNVSILKKIDWIDEIVTVDDSSLIKFITTNISAIIRLIKNRPDVYFDLEIYSDYSSIFAAFTLSQNRIGFYLRSSSFRMGIYTQMMFFNSHVPLPKVYLQLAHLIGADQNSLVLHPLGVKNKNTSKKEYIVINPNASDLRLERRWAKENFIAFIDQVIVYFPDINIYLIGAKNEQTYTTELYNAINDPSQRVTNLSGKTSIDELITTISNAKIMISNDTGPMHIAFSTKTPVISLFGPCSPDQYGYNPYAHIIYKPVYCSPCVHDFEIPPCKGNNVCMKLITVKEVFEKFNSLMTEKTTTTHFLETDLAIYQDDRQILGKVNR